MKYKVENAELANQAALLKLFQSVAQRSGGILRTLPEITPEYIQMFLTKSLETGIILIVRNPEEPNEIIAEIHAYVNPPFGFRHMLMGTTVVVHPDWQGKKLGRLIFEAFLEKVKTHFPHIYRVQLNVRSKNTKAIQFYERLGFIIEGKHVHQIKNPDGTFETPLSMYWVNPNYED